MKKNERNKKILNILSKEGKIKVNDLAKICNVSVVTMRNDLNYLSANNYLIRKHGIASLLDIDNVDDRINLNFTEKTNLAELTATLIKNGDTIFIEGGSSNIILARLLFNYKNLTIITANLYIAQLLKKSKNNIIILGGLLQNKSENVIGTMTKSCIEQINFNKSFIGIDGIHNINGFTGKDMLRVEIINKILSKDAEHTIITDSSKIDNIYPYSIHPISKINRIVMDKRPSQKYIDFLNKNKIKLLSL